MNIFKHYGNLLAAMEEHGDPICRTTDPDAWFPETGEGNSKAIRYAKEMCKQCPLIVECGIYAIAAGEQHGIWGGLDAMQRNKIRSSRNKEAKRVRETSS
jgi:WhiB family redox-sensing transcriptional regulator